MSTENNATTGRTYGHVEREANDTVLFISEQGRRIRFRYSGMSPHYPGVAQYQCAQCPVVALMVNAKFRIVDPCAGHDCSIGTWAWALKGDVTSTCHPQWTPSTDETTTTVSAQQSPATTVLASGSLHPMENAPNVIAKAVYDANGYIQWRSERYAGTTFTFRPRKDKSGRRYFFCPDCRNKCDKYRSCLNACGIESRNLVILGENIIERHPDSVGTNQGHLCQQPLLEEKLKAKILEKAVEKDAPNTSKSTNDGNKRVISAPKIQVFGEPSTQSSGDRTRSLAKRPAALSAKSYADKTFGKVLTVQTSDLTKAEKLAWARAPSIKTGPMRGKELIAYRSQKRSRKFKFLLAGPSSLDKQAYDYYCLGCWSNHRKECRVTVRSSTQEFVITDPDRTSSGRHACIEASSARSSASLALAKAPLSGFADVDAGSLHHDAVPVVEAPAKSIEYFSKQYQSKLKFSLKEQGKNGQAYYVCAKCRTLQRKLKETGYRHSGYTEIRLRLAVVVGGKFERHPDECGVELFVGDTVERRHICHDDKLLNVEGAMCDDRGEPSPKRMRDATQGSPSERTVQTGIRMQSTDQRACAQSGLSRPRDSTADQVTIEQAAATGNDESSRQRERLDLGSAVHELEEVLKYPASVQPESDHLTVQYTPASGMILNSTHASAEMTFRDFRKIFNVPQSTQKVFIFKRNDEAWDVIRDDEKGLPVFNGRVEAKAYSDE